MDPRETLKTLKRDLEDKRFETSLFVRLCGVPMSANEARLVITLMTEIAEIDFPETAGAESPSDKRAAHAYTLSCLTREMNMNVEARQEIARLRHHFKTIAEYEVTDPKNMDAANMVLIAKAALQPNN